MKTKNIMIVGVGGQGTLLTSRVLGGIIQEAGYDVKLSEVHGMAQRGGSVVTFVRYGDKVYEPIVEEGQADVLWSIRRRSWRLYQSVSKWFPWTPWQRPKNLAMQECLIPLSLV